MTIQDFYDWAIAYGLQNFEIFVNREGEIIPLETPLMFDVIAEDNDAVII